MKGDRMLSAQAGWMESAYYYLTRLLMARLLRFHFAKAVRLGRGVCWDYFSRPMAQIRVFASKAGQYSNAHSDQPWQEPSWHTTRRAA